MSNNADSWHRYVGVDGIVACSLDPEPLGGAVVFGGLAATLALSTGMTYLAVVGLGGLVALGLAAGYHHIWEVNDGLVN